MVKADTIEELAEKLHLPVENLKKTVARNNELVVANMDKDFGKEPYRLTPVDKKPFYGCILGGRILCTFDGLRVNNDMQVVNDKYEPIKHLYAAGHAQTFGRLAGRHAATGSIVLGETAVPATSAPVKNMQVDVDETSGASQH